MPRIRQLSQKTGPCHKARYLGLLYGRAGRNFAVQILNATNIQLRRKISALTIHVIFDTPRTMRPFFNTIRMLLFLPLRGWALCLCLTVEATAADVTQDTYPVTNLMTSNSTESGNNLPITLHCQTTPDTSQTVSDLLAPRDHEHEKLTTTNMEVWDYSFKNGRASCRERV